MDFCLPAVFFSEGNLDAVVFLFYLLEKQDVLSGQSSLSVCFPPLPPVHRGTVYCLSK